MIHTRQTLPAAAPAPQKTLVQRMADTMREMRGAGVTVDAQALGVWGDYTDAEVAEHGIEAGNLARTLERRDLAA